MLDPAAVQPSVWSNLGGNRFTVEEPTWIARATRRLLPKSRRRNCQNGDPSTHSGHDCEEWRVGRLVFASRLTWSKRFAKIDARLEELRPLAREASDLQRALDALDGITAAPRPMAVDDAGARVSERRQCGLVQRDEMSSRWSSSTWPRIQVRRPAMSRRRLGSTAVRLPHA
jgi:hypothetical protein